MKKLIYLTAVAGSLLLTTSCVDLTQEPESFITEEEYWNTVDQASLEKRGRRPLQRFMARKLRIQQPSATHTMYVRMILPTVQPRPITNWLIIAD